MSIIRVCSGFQVGADLGGIRAGMDLSIPTFGVMPKGWKTKYGSKPQYVKYGATEHPTSDSYAIRTAWNVKATDATVRFCYDFDSAGEICTYKALKKYNKPFFDINLYDVESGNNLYVIDIAKFFEKHHVEVLNIAGNAGKSMEESKKIYDLVRKHLRIYVKLYNEYSKPKDILDIEDL
jgi:hypothetical protein